jgi:alpha-glucoside transport system permease protein
MKDMLTAIEAVFIGISLTIFVYWGLDKVTNLLPRRSKKAFKPWVFIGPVVFLIGAFIVIPAIQSIRLSFMEEDIDGSTKWVGLENYKSIFGDENFRQMLGNNLLWIAIAPALTVAFGLLIAQLSNQVKPRIEAIIKSTIFMPMTISFVAAATIWRLNFAYAPEGQPQIGLFNAIWTKLGGSPQTWMQIDAFKFNSLLLIVIFIWLNAGFAMVLLSAAIKSVPEDTLEAGRVDGASRSQLFFQIILPQIWPTTLAVFITVLISAMKIFGIVLAMTGGNFGTNVLAQSFYLQYFSYGNTGIAMATVVILMLAIVPVMIYQIRHYRRVEADH